MKLKIRMTPLPVSSTTAVTNCATAGPGWIILAAAVGVAGALISQFVADWLTRGRELRRFRVESFERFRSELSEDEKLRVISNKHTKQPLTDGEMQDYLGFWEEVGIYHANRIIDEELLDEILGDYITDCYNDGEMRKFIAAFRAEERDDTYYEFFEKLARSLLERRAKRINK